MNFDYRAVEATTPLAQIFGGDEDIGKGVSALLIARLVQDGRYTVIEYAALDKVLAEQDLSRTERADPLIASRLGRMLGVDGVLVGSILRFGPEQEPRNGSGKGNPLAMYSGRSGAGLTKSKAAVEVMVRVVNPLTGDLIAAVTGSGVSVEAGTFYYAKFQTKQGSFDFSSSQFAGTVLGEALHAAVDQAAAQILEFADKIPFAKYEVSGLVADVSGNELTLNLGSNSGVKIGEVLQVRHCLRRIQVPLPGAGVREITATVGTATVTGVETESSTATFSGDGPVAIGDQVSTRP